MLVDKLAKTKHSTRNAASASLIAIAAFAMYNWTVTPHSASLSSAKAYESIVDNLAKEHQSIAMRVKGKRKELEKLQQESAQIHSTLFTPDAAREFFSDIEIIAGQTGCAVHSFNLLPTEREDENKQLGIRTRSAQLSVVSLYRDIAQLIRRLQARSQKVWLDSIELQAISADSDKVACSLTLTICETINKDTP